MEHKLTITVPDEVYGPLVEAAAREGRTPEEEAALRLKGSAPKPPHDAEARDSQAGPDSFEQLFGSVSLGHPTGADNENIDRDLAREYAATHEDAD
ncbi:MAG: hypothetical protein ACR2HX_12580 [Pyrinomonadaceae bacterium]